LPFGRERTKRHTQNTKDNPGDSVIVPSRQSSDGLHNDMRTS
jgi:hypothetical protein